MTDAIVSRIERRQRIERRRIGILGLTVLLACLAATIIVLLIGMHGTAASGSLAVHGHHLAQVAWRW